MGSWYRKITAQIVVNPGSPYEAELVSGQDSRWLFTEIHYSDGDQVHNTITISVLAANQGGLLYSANYIVVNIRYSPQNQLDIQILESLQKILSGLQQAPYMEGKSSMLGAMEQALGQETDTDEQGNVYKVPQETSEGVVEPEDGQLSGITIGGSTLLGVFGPYPDSKDYIVKSIVRSFRQATQQMVDTNLLEFIEVDSQIAESGVFRSEKGQQAADNERARADRELAHFYYVVDTVLANYPALAETYGKYARNLYNDIEAAQSPEPVDLKNSPTVRYVIENQTNSTFDTQMWEAIINMDDNFLAKAENYIKQGVEAKLSTNDVGSIVGMFSNRESFEKELDDIGQGLSGYAYTSVMKPEMLQYLDQVGLGSQSQRYVDAASQKAMEVLNNQEMDGYYVKRYIIPYRDVLNLPPQYVATLDQWAQELENERLAEIERQQEAKKEQALMINWDVALVHFPTGEITRTSIRSDNYGPDQVGEWIVENNAANYSPENAMYDAYDRAEEYAHEHIEERPSASYRDDKKEIAYDIRLESDEYWEEVHGEEWDVKFPDEETLIKWVKANELNEFIEWKIEKLQELEEGDDSWKYEPDYESQEYQQKVYEMEYEVAFEQAIEEGYGYIAIDWDTGMIEIEGHSKNQEKMKSIIRELAKRNIPKRDYDYEEGPFDLDPNMTVHAGFVDLEESENWGPIAGFKQAGSWYRRTKNS